MAVRCRGSHIFYKISSQMAVRLSALRTGRPLPPGIFLVEAESIPGLSAVGRIRSIEKSNDLVGNRTRDLPTCSIVPQPTTPPRAHCIILYIHKNKRVLLNFLS
jgi:hypothetical protein